MPLPAPMGKQHYVVYLPGSGHQVVLGTAGTGKTVMAIHRAAFLASPSTPNNGAVLLVTHNKSLTSYLRYLSAELTTPLTVETYGQFGRGYLASLNRMSLGAIATSFQRESFVEQAIWQARQNGGATKFLERPTEFFLAELEWIDAHGLYDLQPYMAAVRIGRMRPLLPNQRQAVWYIRDIYRTILGSSGKSYDWPGIATAVRVGLGQDVRPRMYRHVVIDEAQDLSPEAIRSLVEAIQPGGSITLFADYAQQIYGHRMSWKSVGLNVVKPEEFVDNYRNTQQIARLALAMAAMPHFQDSPDLVEPSSPTAAGPKPTLARCRAEVEEVNLVKQQAMDFSQAARVAILARTRSEVRVAVRGLQGVRVLHDGFNYWDDAPGIYAGTYHSAKGLEFDVVILPFCGRDRRPDPDVVAAFGEDEAMSREARLLYVGVTRARTELLVTYSGELTPILPDPTSDLWN